MLIYPPMYKAIWVVAVFCLVFSVFGSSQQSLNFPITLQNGLAGYLAIEAGNVSRSLFDIRISQNFVDGRNVVRFQVASTSGRSLAIDAVSLRVLVPAATLDGVWTPSGRIADDRLISAEADREFVAYSAANYGIPYLAGATSAGGNVLSMGLLQQDLPAQLRSAPGQNGFNEFQVRVDVPPNRAAVDYQFFISNETSYSWFEIAQKYADWIDAGTNY